MTRKHLQLYPGLRIGHLVLQCRVIKGDHYLAYWLVKCDCGVETNMREPPLYYDQRGSCGCATPAHGMEGTPTYRSWSHMVQRCTNSRNDDFRLYGGRGIRVCDQWLSFKSFMKDMGERPSLKHSLDRWPDKNGNYEPGNVRWANPIEQGNNTRSNICIEWGGERKTLSEWSRLFGKERCFIRRRKNRLNTLDPLVLFQGLAREGGDAS